MPGRHFAHRASSLAPSSRTVEMAYSIIVVDCVQFRGKSHKAAGYAKMPENKVVKMKALPMVLASALTFRL